MNAKAATQKEANTPGASEKPGASKKSAASKKSGASKASAAAKAPRAAKAASPSRTPAAAQAPRFDPNRLMQVLIAPQISEKSTFVGEKNNQWVFRVAPQASKPEIKAAVELMFKVQVEGVQTSNTKGKETRRLGRPAGRRRNWKKAFVSLKKGQEISFTPSEIK